MAPESSLHALDAVAGLGVVYLIWKLISSRHTAPPPPGPHPHPIIGNLLAMPKEYPYIHWAKYKDLYGPISSVTLFGHRIVIINDRHLATEMFEKNSAKFSNRPSSTFAELCGMDNDVILLQPGHRLRTMRRHFHQFIGTRQAVTRLGPIDELQTRWFLHKTMQEPDKFLKHIRKMADATILDATYGYKVNPNGPDALVDFIQETKDGITAFAKSNPGAWMVDVISFLKYLPEWLPGMGFKRSAKEWKGVCEQVVGAPYRFTERQINENSLDRANFTSTGLSQGPLSDEGVNILKWSAYAMYSAGSDTTVAANSTFFLAMVLHPEVLRRAQAEIDTVVGTDRLPTLSDRPNLPYIEAVVKESLRWNVVGPMGVPHVAAEDGIIEGYLIPKDSTIIPNVWWFSRDPADYHEPTVFKPERFLCSEPEVDPRSFAFGFGRRICPGRELAEASIFLTVAMSVAAFDIRKAKDACGNDIEPCYEYTDNLISHPKEFVCSITPRSQKVAELIESVMDENPFETGDADKLDLHI